VAPLTATALAAADSRHSGLASGVNNAVARVGSLLAVAAVPLVAGLDPSSVVAPDDLVSAFHRAMVVAAAMSAVAGALAYATIRADVLEDQPDGGAGAVPAGTETVPAGGTPCFHCGVAGTPLVTNAEG
jgi:hypothetical protein